MRRRRRGIAAGTIMMLLFTVVVLTATFLVMQAIRRDEGDLAMDAEQLLASVNELVLMSQHHLKEDDAPQAPAATAMASASTPQISAAAVPQTQPPVVQSTAYVQPQSTATPEQARTLTLTIGGSVTLESAIVDGAYSKAEGVFHYQDIFSRISDAVHADLNLLVLENVFTADANKRNDMVAPVDSLDALTAGGFDGVVLSAENVFAGGKTAVQETLAALQSRGLTALGLRTPESSQRIHMLQINGMRLAVIAYTDTLSAESKRGVPDEALQASMINLFSESQALEDVASAKQQGAQAVVVFLHWGSKAGTAPSQRQKNIAQTLCDAGVDVIVGTKSRAVQNVEWVTSTDHSHETLVAWSLGTLLCEDRDTREVVSGALLHLRLTLDADRNGVVISNVEYTPTYVWRQEENGANKYRVVLSAQTAPQTMIQKQQEIMDRSLKLIQNVFAGGAASPR